MKKLIFSLIIMLFAINGHCYRTDTNGDLNGADIQTGSIPDAALASQIISDVVDDTTPQLGGNIDVNGKEIQSTANIVFQLGDNAGAYTFTIQDSDGSTIYSINSDGELSVVSIDDDLQTSHVMDATADGISDDTYTGEISIKGITAGESITQWQPVFLSDSDGEWHVADGSAGSGNYPADGFATATVGDGSTLIVLKKAIIRNDGWSWSGEGSELYLSNSGGLTETAPSTSNECIQLMGITRNDDMIILNISPNWALVE